MGCLRLGFAFIASLLMAVVFTIVGGVFGAVIYSVVVSHDATAPNLSSPGVYIGGGVGLLIGLLVMRASLKRAANVNWLKSNGMRITARVVDIEKKMGIQASSNRSQWANAGANVSVLRNCNPMDRLQNKPVVYLSQQ
jgi:hypothetical protein